MSENTVDARGQSCPVPVIMTKEALGRVESDELRVLLDDPVAKENVSRLAWSRGYSVEVSEEAGEYELIVRKNKDA